MPEINLLKDEQFGDEELGAFTPEGTSSTAGAGDKNVSQKERYVPVKEVDQVNPKAKTYVPPKVEAAAQSTRSTKSGWGWPTVGAISALALAGVVAYFTFKGPELPKSNIPYVEVTNESIEVDGRKGILVSPVTNDSTDWTWGRGDDLGVIPTNNPYTYDVYDVNKNKLPYVAEKVADAFKFGKDGVFSDAEFRVFPDVSGVYAQVGNWGSDDGDGPVVVPKELKNQVGEEREAAKLQLNPNEEGNFDVYDVTHRQMPFWAKQLSDSAYEVRVWSSAGDLTPAATTIPSVETDSSSTTSETYDSAELDKSVAAAVKEIDVKKARFKIAERMASPLISGFYVDSAMDDRRIVPTDTSKIIRDVLWQRDFFLGTDGVLCYGGDNLEMGNLALGKTDSENTFKVYSMKNKDSYEDAIKDEPLPYFAKRVGDFYYVSPSVDGVGAPVAGMPSKDVLESIFAEDDSITAQKAAESDIEESYLQINAAEEREAEIVDKYQDVLGNDIPTASVEEEFKEQGLTTPAERTRQAKADTLREDITYWEGELNSAQAGLNSLDSEYAQTIQNAKVEFNSLKGAWDAAKAVFDSLEKSYREATDRFNGKISSGDSLTRVSYTDSLTFLTSDYGSKKPSAEGKVASAEQAYKTSEQKLASLNSEYQSKRSDYTGDIEEAESELKDNQAALEELESNAPSSGYSTSGENVEVTVDGDWKDPASKARSTVWGALASEFESRYGEKATEKQLIYLCDAAFQATNNTEDYGLKVKGDYVDFNWENAYKVPKGFKFVIDASAMDSIANGELPTSLTYQNIVSL